MSTDRWNRLAELFTEAVDRPAGARAVFLTDACGADTALRDEITALLLAAEQSGDFLAAPALDLFARQIVRDGWIVQPGDRIGAYTVDERLGSGATGEVWRAHDDRLARDVAIKLLLPHPSNARRVRSFEQEARAAGSLNHPNVLTVYDVGVHGDAPFLITECLEGESLRARIGAGPLSIDAALDIAVQAARGLEAAHERGIVHRDLKPENVFLARDGRVKILDFGLATLSAEAAQSLVAGTAGYMAPEQVLGAAVDARADIFALGAVLYEMLAGCPPFKRESALGTLEASLTLAPRELVELVPQIPPSLAAVVRRCLAKSPGDRFPAAADLRTALDANVRARNPPQPLSIRALLRKPAVIATTLLVVLAVGVGAWRWERSAARVRWARTVAAPEIQQLSTRGEIAEAFLLAREALDIVPDDPHVRQLWLDVSVPAAMTTDPEGADVAFAAYRAPARWFSLGRTPFKGVRIPRTLVRLHVSKPSFAPIDGSGSPGAMPRYRLDPIDTRPAGMVRVSRGRDEDRFGGVGELDEFWLDRFEVTNRQFKTFVDQGGYRTRGFWREPFVEGGRSVPWEEAVNRFRDSTGEPGPATWTSGSYPAGQADFPVGGVSWYEAAAYAEFVGKSLPTIYHWYRAADLGRFADILTISNFSGTGAAPVGSYKGIGTFGTFDMAGNVKEWCWNETDGGRFLLGAAWNEPRYMFGDDDARAPFEREAGYGFRLAKYIAPPPAAATARVAADVLDREVHKSTPIGDDIFAVYRRQFAYDRAPMNAVLEATETTDAWVKQTVVFDAAYGGERMRAFLFLPKGAAPPYQTVVYFPAADAFQLRSSRDMSLAAVDFIVRSGRAFLYPVYKGTYERPMPGREGPSHERELRVAWSRDLGRSIDYLETRADIDHVRLAFYGVSAGADAGVMLTALEPRLKTSVLQGTGIGDHESPEIDLATYAPRIRVPTLMLNGRYDFAAPVETQQRPLFALLGSPREQKRHVIFETGHALRLEDVSREILPWLDRYLGPTR
jgi:eukaryotic-like serine/threonine-protein kinase